MLRKHLLIDTADNVLVDFSPGKLSPNGERKKHNKQTGNTCLLSSLRRLSLFNTYTTQEDKVYSAVKKVKSALGELTVTQSGQNELDSKIKPVLNILLSINEELSIDSRLILSNHGGLNLPAIDVFRILYNHLVSLYYSTCHVVESRWTPSDGANTLMNLLREHGTQMVVGKFGWLFHKPDSTGRKPDQDSPGRTVYAFQSGSFKGESDPISHAVLIDQVKKIDGICYVFFRDPNHDSTPGQPEPVYMLSYTSFVNRLCNLDGVKHSNDMIGFTVHSVFPHRLTNNFGKAPHPDGWGSVRPA